ncbi:hypothetical protein MPDQ_007863 [Monascus purpureus]|uniref:F-box domain-containing protein n=1 Tax=Monascus purpureus TaxID=5098 RepID=A0A507R273_MONPU|nr:hypothetical protein MPDQ_007863 [Monascus purpureus]
MAESPFSHHGDNMGGSKGDPNQCDGEGVASSQDAAGLTSSTTTDKKPLRLLDLPMDILTEIIKETNDLTSLALTCSALHALAIPLMYSRFDIVWPDTLTTSDHPAGVDALSYGLATLVMGEDVFHQLPPPPSLPSFNTKTPVCGNCGCNPGDRHDVLDSGNWGLRRIRRGNYYAQYTRKFSVGNGPLVWVQEYSVTKETGKMLGTLVALAVVRMINLEAFIWDMPTGVVRDIWIALASLADRPGHECRLERVWVRWHDNTENRMRSIPGAYSPSQQGGLSSFNSSLPPSGSSQQLRKYGLVEYPSLSILPPLKSISVLDIDEPSYLEELGILVDRSRDRLKELRIGISLKVMREARFKPSGDWVSQETSTDHDPSSWPRVGGILGILLSPSDRLHSKGTRRKKQDTTGDTGSVTDVQALEPANEPVFSPQNHQQELPAAQLEDMPPVDRDPHTSEPTGIEEAASHETDQQQLLQGDKMQPQNSNSIKSSATTTPKAPKLNLEILELERVSLSIPVMSRVFNWTKLTTLTLLRCEDHEKLWRALRRQFTPPGTSRSKSGKSQSPEQENTEYPLKIKNIHTDAVSPYLMLFMKETIAPNSLESVFLQENPDYNSPVHIEGIYSHVFRRHRLSLRKVLIDSTERSSSGNEIASTRWRKWLFSREILSFVTSGRMPQLRELGMAIHSKDWHFFLQRLPNIPQVRALHIHHIAQLFHRDPKELALQVIDIVSIRPEISVCYIGIQSKCYEILEGRGSDELSTFDDSDDGQSDPPNTGWGLGDPNGDGFYEDVENDDDDEEEEEEDDDDDDDDEDDENENDDEDDEGAPSNWASEVSSTGQFSDEEDGESEYNDRSGIRFRLREILFYDDKISIFKARHAAL